MAQYTSQKLYGQVEWFRNDLNFGFIKPHDGRRKLYVHRNNVKNYRSLTKGETVEYKLQQDRTGLTQAIEVSGPGGTEVVWLSGESRQVSVNENIKCTKCGFPGHTSQSCCDPQISVGVGSLSLGQVGGYLWQTVKSERGKR